MSLMSEIPKSKSRYFYSSSLPCCGWGLALTLGADRMEDHPVVEMEVVDVKFKCRD